VRRQDTAKYAGKKRLMIFLIVMNSSEWVWGKRNLLELKDILEGEFSQVRPHWFMVRLGGESGKWFWLPILRLGGTWLFPLSSRELVHIFWSTPSLFWMKIYTDEMCMLILYRSISMDEICCILSHCCNMINCRNIAWLFVVGTMLTL
jgi:hypothetical protein